MLLRSGILIKKAKLKDEMLQRRAARFVLGDCRCDSKMIAKLGWSTLESRRKYACLKNFHLVLTEQGGWKDLRNFLLPLGRQGRTERPLYSRTTIPKTDICKHSFVYRSSQEFNSLPAEMFSPSVPSTN